MSEPATPFPFDPATFFSMARTVGHGRALGLTYRNHGPDWVELSLPWDRKLVSIEEHGIMATGAIVSLIDTCSGMSVWTRMGSFRPVVTLDLRLDYLRPAARGEEVIARCECYKLTRKVSFVRGIAHGDDPERPIAHTASTFMTLD
jgi:uncharacterized protein (TIGR00369 family)